MKGREKYREAEVIRFEDLLPRDSVKGGRAGSKLVFGLRRPEPKDSASTRNHPPKEGEEK